MSVDAFKGIKNRMQRAALGLQFLSTMNFGGLIEMYVQPPNEVDFPLLTVDIRGFPEGSSERMETLATLGWEFELIEGDDDSETVERYTFDLEADARYPDLSEFDDF